MSDSHTTVNNTDVKSSKKTISWAKMSALVAVVNFLLVLFHFSYLQLRPVYQSYFPGLVKIYDPIKGIDSSLANPEYLTSADQFWRIDTFFIGFFGAEFLIKSLFHTRRKPGVTWFDFVLRRWYEVFLVIPIWQGWRILPVLVRLHKSGLVNLDRAVAQVTYEPVAYLANTMSEYMMVRFINQAKSSIKQGDAAQMLLAQQPYLHVNQDNTIEQITKRILDLTIYKVLPQVQPDLEELLHHNLETTIKQSDFYQIVQNFSPINILPTEMTEQLANYLAQTAVDVVSTTYEDDKGRKILDNFSQEFNQSLRRELQDEKTLGELQSLVSDLLEEVKLNYIQGGLKSDPVQTFTEINSLRGVRES
ncbi:hypothetical protein D0A34_02830 [Microcoleus vaginatus PCC 9802]|uniref:hypothetical protein n=1 Tax=Microcoleus vaginatus TaxID=119532 RepID=UPI00020D1125|nr:hypothetical protein MicvaDRAFT_2908 [Microcoleus vaginatus FGP-2]UNU17938.1 hypothetical protein D0A34_02830 [Microcoleus vaginatus PCC 9802]